MYMFENVKHKDTQTQLIGDVFIRFSVETKRSLSDLPHQNILYLVST